MGKSMQDHFNYIQSKVQRGEISPEEAQARQKKVYDTWGGNRGAEYKKMGAQFAQPTGRRINTLPQQAPQEMRRPSNLPGSRSEGFMSQGQGIAEVQQRTKPTQQQQMPGTATPYRPKAPQAMQQAHPKFGAPGAGAAPQLPPEQRGQMATAALGQMQKAQMQQPGFGGSRFDPNLQSQGGQMAQQAAPQLQGFSEQFQQQPAQQSSQQMGINTLPGQAPQSMQEQYGNALGDYQKKMGAFSQQPAQQPNTAPQQQASNPDMMNQQRSAMMQAQTRPRLSF